MIAEQLRDLEQDYPLGWIEDAIRIATNREARNLNFILTILKRWEIEGRQSIEAKSSNGSLESIKARYADLIED
jgi:DnaD/phage-associated family protein